MAGTDLNPINAIKRGYFEWEYQNGVPVTKICSKCRIRKNATEYRKNKSTKSGLNSHCAECERQRKGYERVCFRWEYRHGIPIAKTCPRCNTRKQASEYTRSANKPGGFESICRECKAVKRRNEYHQDITASRRKSSAYSIKNTYGLSSEQHESMIANQSGKCAICGEVPQEGRSLHVDHCHSSGKIRGLLCRECNIGLGNFRDSATSLKAAIEYLGLHSA